MPSTQQWQASFPYLAKTSQQAQQPSGLKVIPGGAVAEGTEFAGVGIDPISGTTVTPNGTVGTPAQIQTAVAVALKAGGNGAGLLRGTNGR